MEVREGYKQTEIGVIPEDWGISDFGDLVNYTKGYPFKSSEYADDGIRVIRVSDTTYDSIEDGGAVFISQRSANSYKKWSLRENDLIFSTVGSKPPMYDSLVGRVIIVPRKYAGSLLNQNAVVIRAKKYSESLQKFFLNYFRTDRYIQHIEIIFRGNANQASITLVDLFKYKIPLPPTKTEQTAIANALSDADALIQSLTRLIAKKRQIKQGAMQTLLNPYENGRLKEGWGFITYGKAFNFLNTAAFSRAELNHSDECGYVHYGDIHTLWDEFIDFRKYPVPGIDFDKAKRYAWLKEGDIIMADASEDYAGIGKSIEVKNIGGRKVISGLHTYLLRDVDDNFINGYKGYIHLSAFVKDQFDRLATGLKVYGVSKGNLQIVEIPLPPRNEQIKITSILSSIDAELETLETKLTKTHQIKQGMMQNLLTGRIRIV